MGLFSFLNKNKQDTVAQDGGYYSRDDDEAVGARARSKRASSAGEPAAKRTKEGRAAVDPVLPEKKRARRRLVGAIALALGVAIGLPMILDSEPKPLSTDIDIRIPAKEKAPPMAPVAAADALDKSEVIVEPPKPATVAAPVPLPPMATLPRAVAEVKPAEVKPAAKPELKPELKPAVKPELKLAEKPALKPAPVKPAVQPDAERALAILEDKPAAAAPNQKYIVQVAALASQEKANELQGRLKEAGIPSFIQKGSGPLIRVRVGPFSKDDCT